MLPASLDRVAAQPQNRMTTMAMSAFILCPTFKVSHGRWGPLALPAGSTAADWPFSFFNFFEACRFAVPIQLLRFTHFHFLKGTLEQQARGRILRHEKGFFESAV